MKNGLNLKILSNQDLTQRLQKLVNTERKITHLILECINEIDLRKIYLELGYPSLFEYLNRGLGYTPSSAQRRLDGARLLRQIPEVAQKIESGEINLTQVSMLQKMVREVEKERSTTTAIKVSVEQKRDLLEKISNATNSQTEVLLAKEFNIEVPKFEIKTQNHQDESQSLTFHFSKEEMQILNQVRDLISNSTKSSSLKSAILHLANKELKKYTNPKVPPNLTDVESATAIRRATATTVTVTTPSQNLSRKVYRQLIRPGACCEYINPHTNQKCGATKFLNIDHIQPKWAGGDNSEENLQVLCSAHNKFRYEKQIGLFT